MNRTSAVDPDVEVSGKEYATCFVLFGLTGTLNARYAARFKHTLARIASLFSHAPMTYSNG